METKASLRFNSSLPITIEVLEALEFDRYNLLLGSREFTTKSQKKLEQGAKYWGSFGEGKAGIITISNLVKKPNFLQNSEGFLDIELGEFLTQLSKVISPISTLKEWILENLAEEKTTKDNFMLFSDMLLALKEGIVHLPLKHNGRTTLLQIRLDDMEFYCAFESLGAIRGFSDGGFFNLHVLFSQTLYFLKNSEIEADIVLTSPIEPIYSSDGLLLDLKG